MAKVRVVIAEMEGADEAVLGAVRGLMVMPQFDHTQPIPVPEIASPVVEPARSLPPSAPVHAEESPKPPRFSRGGGKPKRQSASAPPPAASSSSTDTGVAAAVVEALSRGPLTSTEVTAKVNYSAGGVYAALKRLRGEGRIEMIEDPNDGLRKNRLL
jgi:hypothetical protein